jgi:hypothetical protein
VRRVAVFRWFVWAGAPVGLIALVVAASALFPRSRTVVAADPTPTPTPPSAGGKAAPDFQRDVLPIFKARCFECHDGRKGKAGLRMDLRSGAFRGGDSEKPGIVAGNPGKSEILHRVSTTNDDDVMPPEGPRLTPAEVQTLWAWIAAGAVWPDALAGDEKANLKHWAFRPPVRPAPPHVKDAPAGWGENPVDRFVLARLKKEGLKPSPEADRVALLRRLSLDLIGLPPTPAEVDAFLADKSPDAYRKAVDRLLASPHYGERWGRLWLDAARYADSDGFEKDKMRFVWFYRDWVVSAFNRDLPYDRFLIEQLAGDQLPGATQDQVVATGFLRNSMINEEGGVDPEQFRMEAMFDRMDAIGKGMLGLTIQCAQCHNHKYDPLTQVEYYRLFAYLNNDHEANVAVYTPDEQQRRAEVFRGIRAVEDDLKMRHPDWRERMHAWEDSVRGKQPAWLVVRPSVDDISTGGQKYLPMGDGSFLAAGYAPTKHTVKMTARLTPAELKGIKAVTAFRLELLNDANLPLGGPGRSIKGTGALTEFKAEAATVYADGKHGVTEAVKIARATADVNPPEAPLEAIFADKSNKKRVTGPVTFAIDGKDETAWGLDVGPGRRNQPRKAVFTAEKPVPVGPGGVEITIRLTQNHGGWNSDDNQSYNLGRIRLSVTDAPDASADPLPAAVREIVERPSADRARRTPAEEAAVFSYWRTWVTEWKDANDAVEALWKKHPEGSTQLVLSPRETARDTRLLKRGDFLKPADPVTAGAPSFLNPVPTGSPPTRLTFARWIADRQAPTTARAMANRVWQTYFGTGLVATPEDLGTQCEPPSHPDLLDWLAVELMEPSHAPHPGAAPWSLKHLHRVIVTSATYRQSSRMTPELAAKDPFNRLLARGPRFRVDAEIVRDVALAASGLLNPKVGGPPVFPPLPGFMLLPPVSYGPKVWPESTGADRYRRALYTFRYRSLPYPALQTFDAPPGDAACVRRSRSNTPLQALMTLNEPVFLEAARALAALTLAEGGKTDAERLAFAFRRCVSRTPTEAEAKELMNLLARQVDRFSAPTAKPWDLAATDPAKPPALPAGVTPPQAAAWTVVARVLLNLDETISKE